MLTHGYADVDGVRLHYVTAGAGPPILFLHGFPEFWYEWKAQLADLSRDHRVAAPDMRGYNLSSKPADPDQYRMELLVADVRALADHLALRPFTLVGHDWGGAVAYAFAITHPEYLERLVVVNAPHPAIWDRELRENPAHQAASQYMLRYRGPEGEAAFAADDYARAAGLLRDVGLTDEVLARYREAWSQPGALTGAINYYRAEQLGPPGPDGTPANGNFAPHLTDQTIRVPTLVIWGERDPYLLASNLDGLERYVPDLTIRRVPDAGHWVVHEQPDLVTRSIREFVAAGQGGARTRPTSPPAG